MLDEDIVCLIDDLKFKSGVDVVFGERDLSANQRPVIELVPEEDGGITTNNTNGQTVELPLTVNIVVDKKDELRGYKLFQTVVSSINTIKPSAGWGMGELGAETNTAFTTFTQTYDESTFTLSFPFNIRNLYVGG